MATAYTTALARSRAYGLLSTLYLYGLTDEVLVQVESVAEFRAALPARFDIDQASAAHQQIFGLGVFPYQSLYLDPDFLLGGLESNRVRADYAAAGYILDVTASEQDHIGHELGLLAFLSGAEVDALEGGEARVVQQVRGLQQAFLDEHLLWWLPCFVCAVRRQPDAFYAVVADMTQDLVMAHRLALSAAGGTLAAPVNPASRMPRCASPLDDPEAGLQEIAAFLATPVCAGLFLSRDDIAQLARTCGLPRGFGDRRQLLTNFLRAAAEFDGVGAAMNTLLAVTHEYASAYAGFAACGVVFAPIGQAWHARVATLQTLLVRIAAAPAGGSIP